VRRIIVKLLEHVQRQEEEQQRGLGLVKVLKGASDVCI
jgi:hypothetical protein